MTRKKVCTCSVQKQFVILKNIFDPGSAQSVDTELLDMEPTDTEGQLY